MREGRPRAVRFRPLAAKVGAALVCLAAFSSGCATEVNTLDNSDAAAGDPSQDVVVQHPTGGKTSSGGATASGGATSSGGTAGAKAVNAFGGTATTGGKTSNGGASATAGAAGTGGASNGGTSSGGSGGAGAGSKNGGAGGGGSGGQASGGSASGGAGGSGGSLACLKNWQGDKCDTCSAQTQSDKLACVDILNCYAANSCGPATCGNNDDKCGANKIGKGTAGFPIASDVYMCLCK